MKKCNKCDKCIHQIWLKGSYYPYCELNKKVTYHDYGFVNIGTCEEFVDTKGCKFKEGRNKLRGMSRKEEIQQSIKNDSVCQIWSRISMGVGECRMCEKEKYYNLKLSKKELRTALNIIKFYKSENHWFKNEADNPELKQKVNDIENEVRRTIIRNNLED